MTDYVILRLDESDDALPGLWIEDGRATASSPARALRSLDLPQGTYVAVPIRSWKPLTVTIEKTTKIKIV